MPIGGPPVLPSTAIAVGKVHPISIGTVRPIIAS